MSSEIASPAAGDRFPLPSRNWAYTVLVPSPPDSVQVAAAAYGWNADQVTPSLLKRMAVTPEVGDPGSVAGGRG